MAKPLYPLKSISERNYEHNLKKTLIIHDDSKENKIIKSITIYKRPYFKWNFKF